MAPTSSLPAADPRQTFRDRTLARLVGRVRGLLPVDAISFVTVDDERGVVERSIGWFAHEPLRAALAAPASHTLDERRRTLLEPVLRRERPLLLAPIDAWESAPELLALALEALGPSRACALWTMCREGSLVACPLRTEIGHALGALVVASLDPGRPLAESDLPAVEAIADLAATALEAAVLLDAEARRARNDHRLERAAEAVSTSLELDEVYRRIVEHAAEVTGATKALLTRLNARAGELRTVASVDFSEGLARRRLSLDSGGFGHVARARRPVLEADDEAGELEHGLMRGERIGSLMHAPIELGPRLYGVLTVAHEQPRRFRRQELDLLTRLARSSAAAIANATDFQRERRIARALTLGFVPESLPELEGYETGLLYAPALGEPTGGDLYGAWRLPGGHVAVLVGDVAGKGVTNAALSSMVRFFIEARSWDTRSSALVPEQANSMLGGRLPSDTFVTAFYGVVTGIAPVRAEPGPSYTAPGSLCWAGAGHLPPLHVSSAGVGYLESSGLPLGVDPRPRYRESRLELGPGDLVCAYTDGLVEARRGSETFGLERLARLVEELAVSHTPEDLVRTVHEEITAWSDGLSDDAVALALRRRPRNPLQSRA
jgi:GAF domain-containing protein